MLQIEVLKPNYKFANGSIYVLPSGFSVVFHGSRIVDVEIFSDFREALSEFERKAPPKAIDDLRSDPIIAALLDEDEDKEIDWEETGKQVFTTLFSQEVSKMITQRKIVARRVIRPALARLVSGNPDKIQTWVAREKSLFLVPEHIDTNVISEVFFQKLGNYVEVLVK